MEKTQHRPATPEQKTFMDTVREVSLRASGIGFIIGDAAFFAADRMNKDKTGALTGLTYLAGAAVAARYGKENPQHHLQGMQRSLREYLQKEGVEIPSGSALDRASIKNPQGLLDQVEGFFYRYPSQILNGMFALGGTFKIASGLKKEQGKYSTIAYGGLVMLAGLVGLLVPEKEPDPAHPPTSFMGKVCEKIQAHPLRVSSAIYLVNNANLVVNAFEQRREHLAHGTKAGYPLTFLTACAYIVSNGLLGLSSKDSAKSTKTDRQYIDALENAAAEVLARQSPELREALVQRVAGHLASSAQVKLPAQQLVAELNSKINAQLPQGQWQQHIGSNGGVTNAPARG